MRKPIAFASIVLLFVIAVSGCGNGSDNTQIKSKPVEVMELEQQQQPVEMHYLAQLNADQVQSYSFKSSGKIAAVYVAKGQHVDAGELLVALDSQDIGYMVDASSAQADAAMAQYEKAVNGATPEEIRIAEANMEKASDAYDFALADFERYKALFAAGAISQQQMDGIELTMNLRKAEFDQAAATYTRTVEGSREEDLRALYAQYNMAAADYNAKSSLLSDCQMCSKIDGFVVDVLQEEGEMVAAGYPVAIVRSEIQTVETGLSQKDVKRISLNSSARVVMGDFHCKAVINEISQVPDKESGTYLVKLILNERIPEAAFYLGSNADVFISAGMSEGIWIPVESILNDGEDYVYVIKEDRAVRKNINLGTVTGDMVMADGLAEGESLVVKGMKNLTNGGSVTIVETDGQK